MKKGCLQNNTNVRTGDTFIRLLKNLNQIADSWLSMIIHLLQTDSLEPTVMEILVFVYEYKYSGALIYDHNMVQNMGITRNGHKSKHHFP